MEVFLYVNAEIKLDFTSCLDFSSMFPLNFGYLVELYAKVATTKIFKQASKVQFR